MKPAFTPSAAREISPAEGEPIEEHHLAEAVKFAAYVALRYGDAYLPTFVRLEDELKTMRQNRSPRERARLALEAYMVEGGLRAIR